MCFGGIKKTAMLLLCAAFLFSFVKCNDSAEDESVKHNKMPQKDVQVAPGITVEDMAYHWAPIHYQEVSRLDYEAGRADYITRVDRNGDFNYKNNFAANETIADNLDAYMYYSVVSSATHYFITYTYYHPYDTKIKMNPYLSKLTITGPGGFNHSFTIQHIYEYEMESSNNIKSPNYIRKLPGFKRIKDIVHDIKDGLDNFWDKAKGEIAVIAKAAVEKWLEYGIFPGLKLDLEIEWQMTRDYTRNDFEGVMFAIKKDDSCSYGTLDAIIAQAHGRLVTYYTSESKNKFNIRRARKEINAVLDQDTVESMQESIPVLRYQTSQEAEGHGAGCLPDIGNPNMVSDIESAAGDIYFKKKENMLNYSMIKYIPTRCGDAEEPNDSLVKNGGQNIPCKYKLINLSDSDGGLWENRSNTFFFDSDKAYEHGLKDHGDPLWCWRGDAELPTWEEFTDSWEKAIKKRLSNSLKKLIDIPLSDTGEKILYSIAIVPLTTGLPEFAAFLGTGESIQQHAYNKLCDRTRYERLNLTDEERLYVQKDNHPWTHNPAQLCQVYLRPKTGNADEYFKDKYLVNPFIDDPLVESSLTSIISVNIYGASQSDLVLYRPGNGIISLMQSIDDGTFSFMFKSYTGLSGYDLHRENDQIISCDYNGDGRSDLILYRPGESTVFVAKSNGDGTFTRIVRSFNGIAGYDLNNVNDQIISCDYNGDGKSDLVLYRPGNSIVFVAKSNGDGTFTRIVRSFNGIAGYDLNNVNDRIISCDYNGDGKSDLVLYRPGKSIVFVAKSNGDGTFTHIVRSLNGIAGYDLNNVNDKIISCDYNSDGKSDLVLYRPGNGIFFAARSNGDGTFTSVTRSHNGIAGFDLNRITDRIITCDYDGDGANDLILYRPEKTAYIAKSNRDGTFSHTSTISLESIF